MGASESTTATADAAPAQPEPAQPAKTEGGGGRTYRSMFRSNELQGKKDSLSRDVCIVFSRASTTVGPDASAEQLAEVEKLRDRRNDIFSRLRAAGLDLRVRQGSGEGFQDKVFVLVGAPEDKLEVMANKIGLEKALKPEFADKTVPIENHTGYAEYSTDTRELFQPGPDTFFTSLERQRMVYRMMEDRPAAVDLDRLVVDRVFDDYFSLPSQRRKLHLIHTWVDASLFTPAPINDIRDYYGEKIAFYFAWLQLYTVWLGWVSVISLLFLVVQAVWGVLRRTTDNPGLPAYAIIIVIATVVFTELWKRRQSVLAFTWNVQDFEEEEPPRPEFLRAKRIQEEPGVYNARGFVAISEDELKNAPRVLVFPYWEHLKRLTVGILATALMIASALVGTLLIMALKLALTEAWREQDGFEAAGGGENAAAIVAATVNGVFITVMNYVWAWVSVRLNAWETHRTDTQYEDSLIIKTFAFQFINSYISLFYIAYIQAGGLPLFGFKCALGRPPGVAAGCGVTPRSSRRRAAACRRAPRAPRTRAHSRAQGRERRAALRLVPARGLHGPALHPARAAGHLEAGLTLRLLARPRAVQQVPLHAAQEGLLLRRQGDPAADGAARVHALALPGHLRGARSAPAAAAPRRGASRAFARRALGRRSTRRWRSSLGTSRCLRPRSRSAL